MTSFICSLYKDNCKWNPFYCTLIRSLGLSRVYKKSLTKESDGLAISRQLKCWPLWFHDSVIIRFDCSYKNNFVWFLSDGSFSSLWIMQLQCKHCKNNPLGEERETFKYWEELEEIKCVSSGVSRYCTLHSLCGTYLRRTESGYRCVAPAPGPSSRHFSLQVLLSVRLLVFLQVPPHERRFSTLYF